MTSDGSLSPEHELVVNCNRPTYDATATERTLELVARGLDWNRVYEIARWHQVRPVLFERLDATDLAMPDQFESTLRAARRSVAQRNLFASDQFRNVVERLHDADVRVLPFKGPAVATDAYDGVSQREFSDIDLLVPRADVPTAMDVLESVGYEWEFDAPRLDDAAVQGGPFTSPLTQEYRTIHAESGAMIEVRWQVGESTYPFPIGFERLWRDGTVGTVCDADVRLLSSTDRVLVLAYHGTKHHWQRLKWLCDVARVLHGREIRWGELLARARRNGLERRLLLAIGLTRRLFDVAVPAEVVERVGSDHHVQALIDVTVERVFGPTEPSIGYWELKRYVGRADNSMLGTVETVARSLLEPKMHEYEYHPLPGRYHPLYYLLRPLRVLTELPSSAQEVLNRTSSTRES